VHGDDPELGPPPATSADDDGAASDPDPPDRLMGRHVPFGPFLGLAALEYVLLKNVIHAAFEPLLGL
jgi:leader peptidase (prepilin peptidase)/N-methyltransferase